MLDESKNRQFNAAWDAYIMEHPQVRDQQILKDAQKSETKAGNYDAAVGLAEQAENIQNIYR
jgi:hypothetical protein